jgi:eukaryotic-like serine/threonine-protein kinase
VTLEIGTRLGPYEILAPLGAGGMGEVYQGRDTRLGRIVAIKVLLTTESGDHALRRARFEREAKAISALNHPNICTLHDVGTEKGVDYLVMEHCEGKTLARRLAEGPLPLNQILDYAMQIADALNSAHRRGIVHRDLKPSNLMITKSGVKVLDFGLAKDGGDFTPDESTARQVSEEGVLLGTYQYMAPEVLNGKEADARSDIFAFGLVMYEMVTGRRAFSGESKASVIAAILVSEPKPVAELRPEAPPALVHLINTCLTKDPDERIQSAHDVTLHLKTIRNGTTPRHRSSSFPSKRFAAAAVLVIAALAASFFFWKWRTWQSAAPRILIHSVAILPFKPIVAAKRDQVLEVGIADTLIAKIGSIRGVVVRPLSAVRPYDRIDQDPIEAGRALGVDAVLDGTVINASSQIRVVVRLLRVSDSTQLWHGEFKKDPRDIFSVYEDIAKESAKQLASQLSNLEWRQLRKRDTVNPEAYRSYIVGRLRQSAPNRKEIYNAITFYDRAIQLDPKYAQAYAAMALAYARLPIGGDAPSGPSGNASRVAAKKALALDPENSDAHLALAIGKMWYDWDWRGSEQEFRRAIALNPNSENAHTNYAHLLFYTGRLDEAAHEAKEALQLDPASPMANTIAAEFTVQPNQPDLLIPIYRRALEVNADLWITHGALGRAYEQKRMYDEAMKEYRIAWAHSGGTTEPLGRIGHLLAMRGDLVGAQKIIDELTSLQAAQYVPPTNFAVIYSGFPRHDQAIAYLRKACQERDVRLVFLNARFEWDRLRSDPRFIEIERCVNLPTWKLKG